MPNLGRIIDRYRMMLFIALVIVCLVLGRLYHEQLGPLVGFLGLPPALVAAWKWGATPGILCALAAGFALRLTEDGGMNFIATETAYEDFSLGQLAMCAMAAATGLLHELRSRKIKEISLQTNSAAEIQESASDSSVVLQPDKLLDAALESFPYCVSIFTPDGQCARQNGVSQRHLGEMTGKVLTDLALPEYVVKEWEERYRRALSGRETSGLLSYSVDGEERHFRQILTPIRDGDDIQGVLVVHIDITEQLLSQEQITRQFEKLNALRSIDMAIMAAMDIGDTLGVVVEQVRDMLDVDGVEILLLNQSTQRLDNVTACGFSTGVSIPLGEGLAGRAATELRTLSSDAVGAGTNGDPYFCAGFAAYYAVPLIAKGNVKGVLEIFNEEALEPDTDWFNFLEMLAGQAAIAVDNSKLFEDLQKSNVELVHAYDATIEGWSRALDLRDKETEGHTQRVTEMTVDLARSMGLPVQDIAHLKRGALLHDIGKMGVPDAILLKPGPLTNSEWIIMKQHTTYANELLSPIEFLRSALDIPHSHHEKWDGTGYPNGLKGEQIPLAARIFSVVDVWDAITSRRPYHEPMSKSQARQHICRGAGTHFDPKVVEAFEAMMDCRMDKQNWEEREAA